MIIKAEHLGDMQFRLETPVNTLIADRWKELGGQGAGPMPGELLFCAVAGCFGQAVAFVAGRMRKELQGLRLEIDGEKDQEQFRIASLSIRVWADSPRKELEKIVATAKKYCFITNSLSQDIPLEILVAEVEPS